MDRYCFICGRTDNLNRHHIYGGSLRNTSEKYGAVADLCVSCHTLGNNAVHNNPEMKLFLQRIWQSNFEETHSREEFIKLFGRSYL